jgi:predicted nucleic acid-binding protein
MMTLEQALSSVQRLYVETTPLIYYVETNPTYVARMDVIIDQIENRPIEAVSSVITLTEVLTQPMRLGRSDIERAYRQILLNSNMFRMMTVTAKIADSAAQLRAQYNLRTPDALHVATAIEASCDALLTNDLTLRRIQGLQMLILDELDAKPDSL